MTKKNNKKENNMDFKKSKRAPKIEPIELVDTETGEIIKGNFIRDDGKTQFRLTAVNSDDHKEFLQHQKNEKYKQEGKRKENFAQAMPKYEEDIVGSYSSALLEALILTIPYMNYNGDDKLNGRDVIEIKNEPATVGTLAKLWGVHRNTATSYIKQFVQDGIWEEVSVAEKKGKFFRFTKEIILKGSKGNVAGYSKKVVLNHLSKVIEESRKELKRIKTKPKTRDEKRWAKLNPRPLALLGALMSKTHYKTFFLLKNHTQEVVKSYETVREVLNSERKIRRFKFLKNIDIWNLYSGQNIKKMNSKEKDELDACIKILIRSGALGRLEFGKKEWIMMNPTLVYVSPNLKMDKDWQETINALFNLGQFGDMDDEDKNED